MPKKEKVLQYCEFFPCLWWGFDDQVVSECFPRGCVEIGINALRVIWLLVGWTGKVRDVVSFFLVFYTKEEFDLEI